MLALLFKIVSVEMIAEQAMVFVTTLIWSCYELKVRFCRVLTKASSEQVQLLSGKKVAFINNLRSKKKAKLGIKTQDIWRHAL